MSRRDKLNPPYKQIVETIEKHGKWIKGKDLFQQVAKELNLSERQVRRKADELVEKGFIERGVLPTPSRAYIYGLIEFGSYDGKDFENNIKPSLSYSPPTKEFQQYRMIFERLIHIFRRNPEKIQSFLDHLCVDCKKCSDDSLVPSYLCELCQDDLFVTVKNQLGSLIENPKDLPVAIVLYVIYEYETLLCSLVYDSMKDRSSKESDEGWIRETKMQLERLRNLTCLEDSLEPKIRLWLPQLTMVSDGEAEIAIRLCLDAVRWHKIDESTWQDFEGFGRTPLQDKAFKAREKFDEEGFPIIEKAFHKPLITKKLSLLRKRYLKD